MVLPVSRFQFPPAVDNGEGVATPRSWSHCRREKLSMIATEWPFADKYSAVAQPQ